MASSSVLNIESESDSDPGLLTYVPFPSPKHAVRKSPPPAVSNPSSAAGKSEFAFSLSQNTKIGFLGVEQELEEDSDDFEPKKASKPKPKVVRKASAKEDGDSDDEDVEPKPAKKRSKKVPRPVEEILADFVYPLPLGDRPLPSIRAFLPPMCGCRFMGFQVRKKASTTIAQQAVEVKYGNRKVLKFSGQMPAIHGGKLRSYKCRGWMIDGFKADGSPKFGRKPGFSDGGCCYPLVIDEVKRTNEGGQILEVGLSAECEAYFRSPEARKGGGM
jgi:hypothetical protein